MSDQIHAPAPVRQGLLAVTVLGLGVAGVLAAYASAHPGNGQALWTLGFSGMLPMKAWLTTGAAVLVIGQLVTASWMYGRLPGAPSWAPVAHRWSGVVAFLLTLPVMFHCIWSLGFSTTSARTVVHSVVGCLLYGAFAAKMLALRLKGLPGWTVQLLGGLVATAIVVLWFGAALWYFTRSGVPLR